MKDKFEESLQRLDRQGVVRPVKTTRWAVPVVPVLKQDGQLRICRDLKMSVNPIALVQTYPVPRIDELFTRLQGGIRFTKLDLKDTYQQIELEKESQEFVTINTSKGLFQYTRLQFGVAAAPTIFQQEMETLPSGLDHVAVYFDDILVTGDSDDEHWANVCKVLECLQEVGLKLKFAKCKFVLPEVQYLGHITSVAGLRPDPANTEAVGKAPTPRDVKEFQSYLGLVNFYRKFLPKNLSDVQQPSNSLLTMGTKWR